MKKCLNCKKQTRENDIYCRNCGCIIKRDYHYIITNILIIFLILLLIFTIIIFVLSFVLE